MSAMPEGNAIVYCQGAYNTPNGKTAHGLVRRTTRYRILSVIDSTYAGQDAGQIIDGVEKNIPVFSDLKTALDGCSEPATHFVIGLAPDGGRLSADARKDVLQAISSGLNSPAIKNPKFIIKPDNTLARASFLYFPGSLFRRASTVIGANITIVARPITIRSTI